ncbi:NAD(P)/FAD-dependent oxidoreductase [Streptomyces sp. NPDC006879]|uniref:NAD(P)/FAD-dependent oxidoreductase n=1 Tax=Streptomyces sp. NPDC006879 TaxID=3364767 RepID=UPI0036AB1570
MTSQPRVVVIGSGLAGLRLAQRTLAAQPTASVTVLGEESRRPYNRVLLAEVLAGRYGPEVTELPWIGSALLRDARAVRIDRTTHTVTCQDGRVIGYDRLVLATGSRPVLPPLRGLVDTESRQLPEGVHSLWTMDDCLALTAAVQPGLPTVVIGGGLLGVSAARALAERGAEVVLAQQGDRLMERQLDPEASALLAAHLTSLGVEVHTECRARGLVTSPRAPTPDDTVPSGTRTSRVPTAEGTGARRVIAVELADGFRLDAALVVFACGIRPRVGLARDAGLAVREGIVVDDELRTSDPDIHAIGDCAEHQGHSYGLAGAALDQADALAARLATGTGRYAGTRALTRLTFSGGERALDLAAFGEPTPRPGDDVLRLTDATRGTYRQVVVRGDRLVGGVLLGELSAVGTLARAWEGDQPLPDSPGSPLLHLLTDDGGS